MDRRALVLGGGGVTGIAWEMGLIAGLAGLGIDLAAADVIIGTSAGSVAGTDIASGQELEALYQAQLAPPAPEPAARIGWGFIGRLLWDVSTSRDPMRARARIGRWALAVPTMPEADRRKVIEARLPASVWPARALKVTAVDARTGEFVVFDSAGDASLVDAVGASCAVPGVWPPVTIGERRFMDGGMRTVANADLAARIRAGGHRRAGGRGHRLHGQPAPAGGRADRGRSPRSAGPAGPGGRARHRAQRARRVAPGGGGEGRAGPGRGGSAGRPGRLAGRRRAGRPLAVSAAAEVTAPGRRAYIHTQTIRQARTQRTCLRFSPICTAQVRGSIRRTG